MAVIIFGKTQSALDTPFEPIRNPDFRGGTSPLTSTEAQSAIEEAYYDAVAASASVSRFCLPCAFDGNAAVGRWLAFTQNNASNLSPFNPPRAGAFNELSLTTNGNSTMTATIFKNGVTTGITISTVASARAGVTGLNLTFISTDLISVQVTAGSSARPTVYLFAKFT